MFSQLRLRTSSDFSFVHSAPACFVFFSFVSLKKYMCVCCTVQKYMSSEPKSIFLLFHLFVFLLSFLSVSLSLTISNMQNFMIINIL